MSSEQNDNKTFVVINLGSAYITGMVARKRRDGGITPIGTSRKASGSSIRHGVIYNIEEVSRIVSQILDELGQQLNDNEIIRGVYVGVVCRSMQSRPYHTSLSLGAEGEIITPEHLQTLYDQTKDARYSGMEILRVCDARYYADGKLESNPKGVRCRQLEARFQIITVRRSVVANIKEVFEDKLGLSIKEILIAPLAEAGISLLPEESMLGSAFINIGAGTTSIAIFNRRLLSALYVLPMGAMNVTQDLTDLNLLESYAEEIKIAYGSMVLSKENKDDEIVYKPKGGSERKLKRFDINKYVFARMHEILRNVEQIIKLSGVEDDIRSNYVFAGGGTCIGGFAEYIKQTEHRLALAREQYVAKSVSRQDLKDYMTEFGLILQAKEECVEYQLRDLSEVFKDPEDTNEETTLSPNIPDNEEPGNTIFPPDTNEASTNDDLPEDSSSQEEAKPTRKGNFWGKLTSVMVQIKEAIDGQEEDEN